MRILFAKSKFIAYICNGSIPKGFGPPEEGRLFEVFLSYFKSV